MFWSMHWNYHLGVMGFTIALASEAELMSIVLNLDNSWWVCGVKEAGGGVVRTIVVCT